MEHWIWIALMLAVAALGYAGYKIAVVSKANAGNDRMQEIAQAISEGARAFLFAEYRILVVFVIVLFVAIGFGIGWISALCFLLGAGFSVTAGYVGMNVATKANVRTAQAAKEGGMNRALHIAFSGGSVMGMGVVGLGLLGCGLIYMITRDVGVLSGFSLGASSIALFARVGGGIYTKAADVGADLVGKVEAGIPEDDPRNPAVIADNVGDNVGDVAGMGADLFESYVGALVSALTLGVVAFGVDGAVFPLLLAAGGILASIIGCFFVRGKDGANPHTALKMGSYVSSVLVVILSLVLGKVFFGGFSQAVAIIAGLIVGLLIGIITEVYTSGDYKSVKKIADQSETGSATTIISGIAVGMRSTGIPVLLICVGIFVAYNVCGGGVTGLYGIALAAVGMLSTTGITVAVDAYGPIADNAGGIAEMAGLDPAVREITDKLDAVGNTTAAMGKGFAIGSAALTALALFMSYAQEVNLQNIDILRPKVTIGLLIGGMLPFLFSAMTMESVSRAANSMIAEVRRQFRTIPGLMEGLAKPDYKSCVSISTTAALKEMMLPGLLAVVAPLAVGIVLGSDALGGMLAGSLVTGVLLAIFMSTSGGAWDNAKKYIEEGHHGGKGHDAHKAAVVGDTVGDPFKDTSGPSINILIKLMTVVALVFASLFGTGLI
ncbi:MAG: sodium-translocating pyrophosphatase [Lachnospiraceae bacterium]|nr:sodium-translocating pyrophosphatase [Lachnospiraceae bacterium]